MIKPFKFLSIKKPIFAYEITGKIIWVPVSLRRHEFWSTPRSNIIREWLSDCFYSTEPGGFDKIKYFPQMDRTCEIIQMGLDNHNHQYVFTAIVHIYGYGRNEYMEVHLMYPIDGPIYITDERV